MGVNKELIKALSAANLNPGKDALEQHLRKIQAENLDASERSN